MTEAQNLAEIQRRICGTRRPAMQEIAIAPGHVLIVDDERADQFRREAQQEANADYERFWGAA